MSHYASSVLMTIAQFWMMLLHSSTEIFEKMGANARPVRWADGCMRLWCRHWVVPMNSTVHVNDDEVDLRAFQAVLDTGSSVITASTADANTINAVSALSCVDIQ
jgi:hypothetical protein